jgi:hypothetical protein
MAAGSGTPIITPSMSIKLASAFPAMSTNPQINKKSITPNFFILIVSFPYWTELLDPVYDLLFKFEVKAWLLSWASDVPAGKELNKNEGNYIFAELSNGYIVDEPLTLLVINHSVKGYKKGQ